MKWQNIFHAIGALSCIISMATLSNQGVAYWSIPVVALIWVIVSYINASTVHRYSKIIDDLMKEKTELRSQLSEHERTIWEQKFKAIAEKQADKK